MNNSTINLNNSRINQNHESEALKPLFIRQYRRSEKSLMKEYIKIKIRNRLRCFDRKE